MIEQKPTGWDDGLLQDYNRKLSNWLSTRLDAKHVVDMAQPEERNICPRCGKRLASGFVEISIHKCTPPKEKNT